MTVRREWLGSMGRDRTGWRLQITVRTREGEIIHTNDNERIICVIRDRQRRNSSGNQGNKMDCVPRCPPPPHLLEWGPFAASVFKPRYGNDPEY